MGDWFDTIAVVHHRVQITGSSRSRSPLIMVARFLPTFGSWERCPGVSSPTASAGVQ
jgi:hypothetical protein